jgi:hypothetical protein
MHVTALIHQAGLNLEIDSRFALITYCSFSGERSIPYEVLHSQSL